MNKIFKKHNTNIILFISICVLLIIIAVIIRNRINNDKSMDYEYNIPLWTAMDKAGLTKNKFKTYLDETEKKIEYIFMDEVPGLDIVEGYSDYLKSNPDNPLNDGYLITLSFQKKRGGRLEKYSICNYYKDNYFEKNFYVAIVGDNGDLDYITEISNYSGVNFLSRIKYIVWDTHSFNEFLDYTNFKDFYNVEIIYTDFGSQNSYKTFCDNIKEFIPKCKCENISKLK